MHVEKLERWIRAHSAPNDSVTDQLRVARWLLEHDVTAAADRTVTTGVVREGVTPEVDAPKHALEALTSSGTVNRIEPPGSGRFILHERTGSCFFDPTDPAVEIRLRAELGRFIAAMRQADMDGDGVIRAVAAATLSVSPSGVERALTGPNDPLERMSRYDDVVQALTNAGAMPDDPDFCAMGWRSMAYRWQLSRHATRAARNRSLADWTTA